MNARASFPLLLALPRTLALTALALTALVLTALAPGAPAMAQPAPAPAVKKKPATATTTVTAPKASERPKAEGPKKIGTFDDWIAATHQEAGQPVCYAFTRAQSSLPALAGRGAVILTVTQRVSGRDAVAMEAGFAFAPNATVTVQADQTGLDFYTAQRAAFARKGHDAVVAFQGASRAIARSPGPRDTTVTDTFSLKGFSAAYAAISKACPPR
jgi:hypothetical protein